MEHFHTFGAIWLAQGTKERKGKGDFRVATYPMCNRSVLSRIGWRALGICQKIRAGFFESGFEMINTLTCKKPFLGSTAAISLCMLLVACVCMVFLLLCLLAVFSTAVGLAVTGEAPLFVKTEALVPVYAVGCGLVTTTVLLLGLIILTDKVHAAK